MLGWEALEPTNAMIAALAGVIGTALASYLTVGQKQRKDDAGTKTRSFWSFSTRGLGHLHRNQVKHEWASYDKTYTQDEGKGIEDKSLAEKGVNTFYNLVTDIYEWGWGQSFHFSPPLRGKGILQSETAHETRVADILGLKPGMTCLDAGCGVGGPLRTIAAHSGASITGVTINDYQVQRCRTYCKKVGLNNCTIDQGNFLDLQYPVNSFDAVYSIEATCHSAILEKAYGQIFKVMKPGAKYVTYEWVTTEKYNKSNPEHVKCIDEINYANALPEMRSGSACIAAARKVGFEVVEARDLAATPAGPWWNRLKFGQWRYKINRMVISSLSLIGLIPKGTAQVHNMLVAVANTLVVGGELGIFSPMYMLVLRKPESHPSGE